MSELKGFVGREIERIYSGADGTILYPDDGGKMVLEHEAHAGDGGYARDCFFAVVYNLDGEEVRRTWIGQNTTILWKAVGNDEPPF